MPYIGLHENARKWARHITAIALFTRIRLFGFCKGPILCTKQRKPVCFKSFAWVIWIDPALIWNLECIRSEFHQHYTHHWQSAGTFVCQIPGQGSHPKIKMECGFCAVVLVGAAETSCQKCGIIFCSPCDHCVHLKFSQAGYLSLFLSGENAKGVAILE